MNDPDIPSSTLRVLAAVLVLAFDAAFEKVSSVAERLKPLVEPPHDLRVVSKIGALYSGFIVLDRSDIIAGVVVQTAQGYPSAVVEPPLHTTRRDPYRPQQDSFSTRLPGWAEDPRTEEDDEVPPWMR